MQDVQSTHKARTASMQLQGQQHQAIYWGCRSWFGGFKYFCMYRKHPGVRLLLGDNPSLSKGDL